MTRGHLPTFIKLCLFLLLDEQRLARLARVNMHNAMLAQAQAFFVARPPAQALAPAPVPSFNLGLLSATTSSSSGSFGNSGKKKRKKKLSNRAGSS
jgi:hypothetical protein